MACGTLGMAQQVAEEIVGQIAVGIEHAAAVAAGDILEQQMLQQFGFALTGHTDDIRVRGTRLVMDAVLRRAQSRLAANLQLWFTRLREEHGQV